MDSQDRRWASRHRPDTARCEDVGCGLENLYGKERASSRIAHSRSQLNSCTMSDWEDEAEDWEASAAKFKPAVAAKPAATTKGQAVLAAGTEPDLSKFADEDQGEEPEPVVHTIKTQVSGAGCKGCMVLGMGWCCLRMGLGHAHHAAGHPARILRLRVMLPTMMPVSVLGSRSLDPAAKC